jgi:N-acyl-D-amino-acid deacylase
MPAYDTCIRNALVLDGGGGDGEYRDLGIKEGRIEALGALAGDGRSEIDAKGLALCPGLIDAHTHDDLALLDTDMLPKLSQGVTTVVVGNCGIGAAPFVPDGPLPDPFGLLGGAAQFAFPDFASYRRALDASGAPVNVAALVGHSTLRAGAMDRLDRPATGAEIRRMREGLAEALGQGAIGLSTGLAYSSALASSTEEVLRLGEGLGESGGIYVTHVRNEFEDTDAALEEAFLIARGLGAPLVISHLKGAGKSNWSRAGELLARVKAAARNQAIGYDCYPYAAGSSILDLRLVTGDFPIRITWSAPHPEAAGRNLASMAEEWKTGLLEAAERLCPAGAIYFNMDESDVRVFLSDPMAMIGSDGLPRDPKPHPRLWGALPRVIARYCREEGLFSLGEAVRKMTSLPAARFGLRDRGRIAEGFRADLLLFEPDRIRDEASFDEGRRPASGIVAVWVNGTLSYGPGAAEGARAGRFISRDKGPELGAYSLRRP